MILKSFNRITLLPGCYSFTVFFTGSNFPFCLRSWTGCNNFYTVDTVLTVSISTFTHLLQKQNCVHTCTKDIARYRYLKKNVISYIPGFAAKPEEEKCRNPYPFYYPMIVEKTKQFKTSIFKFIYSIF